MKICENFFEPKKLVKPDADVKEENKEEVDVKKEEDKQPSILKKKKDNLKVDRIGVHCVAGLGRAPVLVAIALVNKGMAPVEAIELIRKNRKGALNVI